MHVSDIKFQMQPKFLWIRQYFVSRLTAVECQLAFVLTCRPKTSLLGRSQQTKTTPRRLPLSGDTPPTQSKSASSHKQKFSISPLVLFIFTVKNVGFREETALTELHEIFPAGLMERMRSPREKEKMAKVRCPVSLTHLYKIFKPPSIFSIKFHLFVRTQ